MNDIQKYTEMFLTLHTAKVKGQRAPHKAILLLTIIDLVEKGIITSSHIELSEELVDGFNETWKRYLGLSTIFTPDIAKPFFHMQHESFWRLVEYEEACSMMVAEESPWIDQIKEKKPLLKGSYSLKAMRQTFAYAEIDVNLFVLLKNAETRALFRTILIKEYLTTQPTKSMTNLTALMITLSFITLVA